MPRTVALLVAALLLSCAAPAAAVRHLSAAPAPAPASSSQNAVAGGASFITEARFVCPSNYRCASFDEGLCQVNASPIYANWTTPYSPVRHAAVQPVADRARHGTQQLACPE